MKLSENFTLKELIKSNTATRKGIDNSPNDEVISNLKKLVLNVLQPARDKVGAITVSSGYRCQELNSWLGGAKNSQHIIGESSDIELLTGDNYLLFKYIEENLEFDQLIYEYGDNSQPQWIHVSFRKGNNRKEVLRAYKENNRTKYNYI